MNARTTRRFRELFVLVEEKSLLCRELIELYNIEVEEFHNLLRR